MFDDLKTYGIISVLLILILGYFVYMSYRDIMILKNEIKELKEFFNSDNDEEESILEEDGDEEVVYSDIDEYFSHINNIPEQLPVIEEVPEEVIDDKPKKKKQKKQKNIEEPEAVIHTLSEE